MTNDRKLIRAYAANFDMAYDTLESAKLAIESLIAKFGDKAMLMPMDLDDGALGVYITRLETDQEMEKRIELEQRRAIRAKRTDRR